MPKRNKRHKSARSESSGNRTRSKQFLFAALMALSAVAGYVVISTQKTVEICVGETPIKVEIVDKPELRAKGLSGRKRLKDGHGMLFVFEFSRRQSFWMKDTSIPLSIAFISSDGLILQIEHMKPFDLNRVVSKSPAPYALEVNQDFFEQNGITVGMRVDLTNVF